MYCSNCGAAVSPNLTYCNHCGAKLIGAKLMEADKLIFFMTAVFVFGLAAIIGLLAVMKFVFVGPENLHLIIAFTSLSFLIMLAVEGVFFWMLLDRKRGAKETGDTERTKRTTKDLRGAKADMLPEPVLSVTEHTTRTLEPVDEEAQYGTNGGR